MTELERVKRVFVSCGVPFEERRDVLRLDDDYETVTLAVSLDVLHFRNGKFFAVEDDRLDLKFRRKR